MAYDYEYGVDSIVGFTRNQLITAIELFLDYDSTWTVLQNISISAGSGDAPASSDYSILQKTNGTVDEDVYISLWLGSSVNGNPTIAMNTSTGYTPGANWYAQPGARVGAGTDGTSPNVIYTRCSHVTDKIVEYHLFGYPGHFYCVFKTDQGYWRNFGFGHIDKLSDFVGSGFSCASFSMNSITNIDDADSNGAIQFFDSYVGSGGEQDLRHCSQLRYDEISNALRYGVTGHENYTYEKNIGLYQPNGGWLYSGNMTSTRQASVDGGYVCPFEYDKMQRAPTTFSLTSPLIPIYVYFSTDFSNKYKALIGRLPHIFGMNIKSLAETQEITIQGETYMVFPVSKKSSSMNDGTNTLNSYYFGFCTLKKIEA